MLACLDDVKSGRLRGITYRFYFFLLLVDLGFKLLDFLRALKLLQLKLVHVAQRQVKIQAPLVVKVVVLGRNRHQVRLDYFSIAEQSLGRCVIVPRISLCVLRTETLAKLCCIFGDVRLALSRLNPELRRLKVQCGLLTEALLKWRLLDGMMNGADLSALNLKANHI